MVLGRRQLARSLALLAPFLLLKNAAATQTQPSSTMNVLSFGADPSGKTDSAPAFAAAFAALPGNGGSIYVPDGDFRLDSPVVFSGKGVTLYGNGEQATRIFITHTGIAISFQQPSPLFMSCVRDLGLAAVGGIAECAISITYPPFPVYGAQTVLISNVSVPSPIYGAYPNFAGGLNLQGCWQSLVQNFKHLAPGANGPVSGSYFIRTGGRSIDCHFVDCTGQNSDLGFCFSGYTEGIHIQNCTIVSCNYGISMMSPVLDSFESTQQYYTLGLTISDSEIVAHTQAVQANRVLSAYITNSHLGLAPATSSNAAVGVIDSQDVKIDSCTISGQYGGQVGVAFRSLSFPCALNQINNCFFTGVSAAICFGQKVTSNTATGIRVTMGGLVLQNNNPVIDGSGNQSNNAQWMSSTGHVTYLR